MVHTFQQRIKKIKGSFPWVSTKVRGTYTWQILGIKEVKVKETFPLISTPLNMPQ